MGTKQATRGDAEIAVDVWEDEHNTIVTIARRGETHQLVCGRGALSASNRERAVAVLRNAGPSLFEEETWRVIERLREAGICL